MILEFVFEVDIIWTHFLHILDNVNGNHSFTLFPFYLINIFITKLLEKPPGQRCPGGFSLGGTYKECKMQFLYVELTIFVI